MMHRPFAIVTLLVLASLPARAHIGSHEIAVRDGAFEPQELRIDVGETVTWNVLHGGHTITADDGRFHYPGDRLVRQGDRFQWTFTEDETFFYHCQVHRGSMFGVVIVGEGSPAQDPNQDPPEVRAVPEDFPTITAAIATAPPGTVVELAPGPYRESIVIDVPDLVLRGSGAARDDVTLEGGSQRGIGVTIAAPGVRLENLTIRRYTFAAVFGDRSNALTLAGVDMLDNDRYGVRAQGARGIVVRDSTVRGSLRAGISIEGCDPCDALIERVVAERNLYGLGALNAGGVVIRSSVFRDNGAGIALRSFAPRPDAPQSGAHVYGNLIEDNRWRPRTRPPVTDAFEIPSGSGVWIDGGWSDVIESNVIRGNLHNVAVTGFMGPSASVRVRDNIVSDGAVADLGWDGLGVNVCFGTNLGPDGAQPVTQPPAATRLYDCALPATMGVPYPPVNVAILQHAGI